MTTPRTRYNQPEALSPRIVSPSRLKMKKMTYMIPTVFKAPAAPGFPDTASKTMPAIMWIMLATEPNPNIPNTGVLIRPQTPAMRKMIPKTIADVFDIVVIFNVND